MGAVGLATFIELVQVGENEWPSPGKFEVWAFLGHLIMSF